jgi:hypothetical protein
MVCRSSVERLSLSDGLVDTFGNVKDQRAFQQVGTMLNVAVGHSNDPDSLEAIQEVLQQCQSSLSGRAPKAGILFAAVDFDHPLILDRIQATFPNLELIGCTTDGELSSVLEFQQDSLTLMLFCTSDDIEIRAAVGRQVSQNPVAIAQQAVTDAQQRLSQPVKFCIAVPESLTTNASAIVAGLQTALGDTPIYGGAAADQIKDQNQTYQFFKTEVLSDAVPLLLFAGNVIFSHGVASGWRPVGKRAQITKSQGNIIYEIDGKPALEFYHYYLNKFAIDTAYPLAVFAPGENQFFLRGALAHDPATGSITVSGDFPEQSTIQITDASLDDIVTASKTAFADALAVYPGEHPDAALFFSCAWRRFIMGTRTPEEYQLISQHWGNTVPGCGFYTFGEIAPIHQGGATFFHNTTFVTLLLGSD